MWPIWRDIDMLLTPLFQVAGIVGRIGDHFSVKQVFENLQLPATSDRL